MEYQTAIDTLRLMMNVRIPDETKAIGIAISSIEKQVPKKVKYSGFYKWSLCPTCSNSISDVAKFEYCLRCGQKLDWSDVT